MLCIVVFAAWKEASLFGMGKTSGWARERANETAGHVVMTDDQKFDLMNGKEDLRRASGHRTEGTQRTSAKIPAINQGANFPNEVGRLYSMQKKKELANRRHSILHRTPSPVVHAEAGQALIGCTRTRGFWHFTNKFLPKNQGFHGQADRSHF